MLTDREIRNDDSDHIIMTLLTHGKIAFGWTDGEGSRYDLLLVTNPVLITSLRRGLNQNDLFVSVFGYGAHGFRTDKSDTVASYYCEKLGLGPASSSTFKLLAELLNRVRKAIGRYDSAEAFTRGY